MIDIADRVALRVSPRGTIQLARQQGAEVEVIAEFEFGQLETVTRWISQAMTAWAPSHRPGPEPAPWFGTDPRAVSGRRASRSPQEATEPLVSLVEDRGGGRSEDPGHFRLGPLVPVEALATFSRLPRDRWRPGLLSVSRSDGQDCTPTPHPPCLVDGFAGFKWGTRRLKIPDLAWMDPAGETLEGVPFYVTYATLVNEKGFAAYYVDPLTEELVGGAYVFSPSLEHWESAWHAVTESIRAGFPGLSLKRRVHFPHSDPRRKFAYVDGNGDNVVSVSMGSEKGIPLLHVLYRSHRLLLRQEQAIEEDRRKLGPVGEVDPDSIALAPSRDATLIGEG